MKKQIIILGTLVVYSTILTAQNFNTTGTATDVYRSGKTGFGMTGTPLINKIEIESTSPDDGISITQKNTTFGQRGSAAIYLKNLTGHNWGLFSMGTDNNIGGTHFAIYDLTSSNPRFFIHGTNGNIGIGTVSPSQKLEVAVNNLNDGININQSGNSSAALHLNNTFTNGKHWALFSTGNGSSQGPGNFSIYDYNVGVDRLFIAQTSGNVGIGTNAPTAKLAVNGNVQIGGALPTNHIHYNNMLSVKGKIVAQEIIVTVQNWPDFVFSNEYKMPTLKEVEAYYEINKHLPEIPSSNEVSDNGISLGEMNKLLLQKIEELTIYAVEQNKKTIAQQAEIDKLKKAIDTK